MTIQLNKQERELLIGLLEREISELGPEIRHTQTSSYRDDLKAKKIVLRDLCDRVRSDSDS